MREFKDPYYSGPDCVCCKKVDEEAIKQQVLDLAIKKLELSDSVCADWAIAVISDPLKEDSEKDFV